MQKKTEGRREGESIVEKTEMSLINPAHRAIFGARFLGTITAFVLLPMPVLAGPPFQTDDPQPIFPPLRVLYLWLFGWHRTGNRHDLRGFELNWGALPNVHLHIIVPAAAIFPAHDPRAYGIGDIELGIKLRFIQETKHRPMIGTFTMFEMPSGDAGRGLA